MGGSISAYRQIEAVLTGMPGYSGIRTVVETGTYQADSCICLSPHFDWIYTIELSPELYQQAVQRAVCYNIHNIIFLWGDSSDLLPRVCSHIREPALFYLDAHFCGRGRGSCRGPVDVPLFDELAAIDRRPYNDLIIIDDVWLFGKKVEDKNLDWTHVTEQAILDSFRPGTVEHCCVHNDWLVIYRSN